MVGSEACQQARTLPLHLVWAATHGPRGEARMSHEMQHGERRNVCVCCLLANAAMLVVRAAPLRAFSSKPLLPFRFSVASGGRGRRSTGASGASPEEVGWLWAGEPPVCCATPPGGSCVGVGGSDADTVGVGGAVPACVSAGTCRAASRGSEPQPKPTTCPQGASKSCGMRDASRRKAEVTERSLDTSNV